MYPQSVRELTNSKFFCNVWYIKYNIGHLCFTNNNFKTYTVGSDNGVAFPSHGLNVPLQFIIETCKIVLASCKVLQNFGIKIPTKILASKMKSGYGCFLYVDFYIQVCEVH